MIKSIFYNSNYAIVLTDDGKVYSWGKNSDGKLGLGHTRNENTPKKIEFPNNVKIKEISSSGQNSIAIDEEGNLYVWGNDDFGQLGFGRGNVILKPEKLLIHKNEELKFKQAFCSFTSSMLIAEDNTLFSSGFNEFKQLGVKEEDLFLFTPITLPNGVGAKSIEYTEEYSMVIGEDRKLYSCGNHKFKQLGIKRKYNSSSFRRVSLPNEVNIVSVSSDRYNSIALTDKGELYAWGQNNNGQLGTGDEQVREIPVKISLPNNIKAKFVLTGLDNSIAIGEDDNLYAWGIFLMRKTGDDEEDYETLLPKKIDFPNNAKPISISKRNIWFKDYNSEVTFVVCDDGNLYAIESLSYDGEFFFLPLDITKDNENYLPKRINILNGIKMKSVFVNNNGLLIATNDGDIYTLGGNEYGELGIGNNEDSLKPMKIILP